MLRLIAIILVLVSVNANADKIILGGASHHFDTIKHYDFNEENPAIGFQRKDLEIAVYKNSLYRTSLSVTKIKQPIKYKGLDIGIRYGFASGYKPVEIVWEETVNGHKVIYETEFNLPSHGIVPIFQVVASK